MSGYAAATSYAKVWGPKLGVHPAKFYSFDQGLGDSGDVNCGVYAVKWLRKRRGGKFLNYDNLSLDREPGPENADDVIVGPSSAFRTKVSGYKNAWTEGRPATGAKLKPAVVIAVQTGFHTPGVTKFSRDTSIDYEFSFQDNVFERAQNGVRHMMTAGTNRHAYFVVLFSKHFCAAIASPYGFEWFDPSCGMARVFHGSEELWLQAAMPYFIKVMPQAVELIGFREA